jgi:hypothetical protein
MSDNSAFKDRREAKNRSLDVFVVLFCIAGTAASLYVFYQDFFLTYYSSSETQTGKVIIRQNIVQRRVNDRVIWDRLFNDSPVYNGDVIRVARLSGAELNIDESHIELGENTLIRIQKDEDLLRIEFFSGEININANNSGSPVLLSIGEQVVEAAPGAVLNASLNNNGAVLRVKEGKAYIIQEGQASQVSAGNVIIQEASANGRMIAVSQREAEAMQIFESHIRQQVFEPQVHRQKLAPIELKQPSDDGFLLVGAEKDDFYFTWEASKYADFYTFIISPNRSLSNPVITKNLRDNFYTYKKSEHALEPGIYYWNVSYTDTRGNMSIPAQTRTIVSAENAEDYKKRSSEVLFLNEMLHETLMAHNTQAREAVPEQTPLEIITHSEKEEEKETEAAVTAPPLPTPPPAPVSAPRSMPAPRPAQQRTAQRREAPSPAITATEPAPQVQETALREVNETFPLLPTPQNMLPANGYRLDAEQLRQQRIINFSWLKVEGANSYILTIFKENALRAEQVFQTEISGDEPKYTFDNFRLLDNNGTYIWQLEAIAYNSDDIIDKRGKPGENTLILDIPRPGRVRVRDMGVLYGTE